MKLRFIDFGEGDPSYEVRDEAGKVVMDDAQYYNYAPRKELAREMVDAINGSPGTLTITLNCNGEAMLDPALVAYVVKRAAHDIQCLPDMTRPASHPLMDVNGNTVGEWRLEP